MLQALPMASARNLLAAHSRFHDKSTSDSERNALVCDVLQELRQHDPDISVWDLLPIFDREALR